MRAQYFVKMETEVRERLQMEFKLKLIKYNSVFEKARAKVLERDEAKQKSTSFKRKIDSVTRADARDVIKGDLVVAQINHILANFEGFKRSPAQENFHRAMIIANLPHIYGISDFEKYRERLLKDFQVDDLQQELLICCPRRFGKTVSVAMFVAALLYAVDDSWISCFSTGQRASTSLLDQAAKFLMTLPDAKNRIVKKNQEQLFVKGENGNLRRFHSFPSSVAGLKGQGGRTILLEEASRLDEAVFQEVCIPLLGVSYTSLIAISTPLDENNFFSQLLKARKPNGTPLFKTLQIQLICQACLDAQKTECPHLAQNLPQWKSSARAELVKDLMANDTQMFLREAAGIITNRDAPAFERADVEWVFANPVSVFQVVPQDQMVWIVVDPSGGGFSYTSAVATVLDTNTKELIIVGASAEMVSNDMHLERFLRKFAENLRAKSTFSTCTFVIIVESNYGGHVLASRIVNIFIPFPPAKYVTADTTQARRPGVTTTETVKERSRVDLGRLMRLQHLRIVREIDLTSTHTGAMAELRKQMLAMRFQIDESKANNKVKLSGKSKTQQDDLCIALMLSSFWISFALSTPASLHTV